MRTVLVIASVAMLLSSVAIADVLIDDNWDLTMRGQAWAANSTYTVDTAEKASGVSSLKVVAAGDGGADQAGMGVWMPTNTYSLVDVDPTAVALTFKYKLNPEGVHILEGNTVGHLRFRFQLLGNIWGNTNGHMYLYGEANLYATGQWETATVTYADWNNAPPENANITALGIHRDWWSGSWEIWGGAHQPTVWFDAFEFGPAAPPVTYLAGDANKDGYVNDDDLSLLLSNWRGEGRTWDDGDFNGDGVVNDDDLSLLLSNWRQGTPPAGNVVPEPATLSVLGLGALALIRRRRAA